MLHRVKDSSNSITYYKVVVFILFLLVVYLYYTLIQLSKSLDTVRYEQGGQLITQDPPKGSIVKKTGGIQEFTHPSLKYSVNFPSSWKPQFFKSIAGKAVQPYRDFIAYSPDYQLKAIYEPSIILQDGASILIRGEDTKYTNIEEKFEENVIAQKIARNITKNTINGIPIIQYDYSANNENATNVVMIKNGIWYLFKFQYTDEATKREYLEIFQSMLKSFSTKE